MKRGKKWMKKYNSVLNIISIYKSWCRNQLENHSKYGKVILIMRTKLTLPQGDNTHEKGTFFQIFVTSKQATCF